MQLEAHQIPKSLQSYIDQFEKEPDAAIERLKKHVIKRSTGAVGYFFLAWLYHRNGERRNAIQAALYAKTLAPGSRLMEHLHYMLAHPHAFNAWEPETKRTAFRRENYPEDRAHPIQDLDMLIAKLSSIEKTRIKPDTSNVEQPDLSKASSSVDDIVTETLAKIHENQKNYQAAINTFKKLRITDASKKDYYDEQIFRLQHKLAETKKEKED